jgi:hypothetical protein
MAEPTPAYPSSEPMPASTTLSVVAEVQPTPTFYDQLCFQAGRTFHGVKGTAEQAFTRIKEVSGRVVEERPIQVVVGVAIGAFLAGAGLRIWRSYHD